MKPIKFIFIGLLVLFSVSCVSRKIITEKKIEKTYDDNLNGFGTFIWYREKDSTVVINKKNLEKIYKETAKGNSRYFDFLDSYLLRLTVRSHRTGKNLKFSERAYIVAYVVEYLYKCQQKLKNDHPYKNKKFVYRVLSVSDRNKYNEEFKKHDYYSLELLKKHHFKNYRYLPNIEDYQLKPRRSDSQD